MAKKTFFKQSTKAEIRKKDLVETQEILEIGGLDSGQYTIISLLVPRGYSSARKFMKHGPDVKPRRFYSLDQAVKDGRVPVILREDAFDRLRGHEFCGYTLLPIGRDRRKRKISLIECLEGARLFAYGAQIPSSGIGVKPYSDAKRVRIDGSDVVARVPSRTKKQGKYQLKLTGVPIVDSPEKHIIVNGIGSDHSCGSKRFNIRYTYTDDKESSGIVNACPHEIAAYFQLVQQEWEENKNLIPLQMSPYAIPSQETVDYYLKWENNVLVYDKNLFSKDKLRKPNRAEKEIGLWARVGDLGHDKTFFSKQSRDGDLRGYCWS